MRPLTYYVGMSLDGFIAGPGGEVDDFPVSDDHVEHMVATFPEVLPTHARRHLEVDDRPNRRFDTVVMGRGTYEPALAIDVTDPYAHLRTVVVSRDPDIARGDERITVTDDPVAAVRALKADRSDLGVWLAGGGQLAGALADEIDELVVKVYPLVLGDGVRPIDGDFAARHLVLGGSRTFDSGCTELTYRRA